MLNMAVMFARMATGWDDVDWPRTLGVVITVGIICLVVVAFCRSLRKYAKPQSDEWLKDYNRNKDNDNASVEQIESPHIDENTEQTREDERTVKMICDYCENEIVNPIGDTCPFCGAPIKASDAEMSVTEPKGSCQSSIATDSEGSFYVVCKACGRTTSRETFNETGKCTWCGSGDVILNIASDFKPMDVRDVGKRKLVRCPECQCDNELSDIVETRKCKYCGADLLPEAKQTKVFSKPADSPQVAKIRSLITSLRNEGLFSGVDVSDYGFMPTAGEIVYEVVDDITLNESRSIRRSHTEKTGSSVYDYEGRSESKTHYEFQVVTNGNLFLTNKRVVFTGGQQVRNIKFDDIVSFESDWKRDEGAIQISSSKRTKAMRFTGADVFRFTLIYNAIRSAKFRNLFEKGPDEELIAKFVEVGLCAPRIESNDDSRESAIATTEHEEEPSEIATCGCVVGIVAIIFIVFVIIVLSNS